jgi:hypothetical protein
MSFKNLDVDPFDRLSFPEDRCTRLLIKNLGRRIPEDDVREELEALGICVLGVIQLRSGRRDQNPEKDLPATPHFIVTVARGPEVSKIRSITQLCGLRVTVESYTVPKGPLQCKRCQRFGHTLRNSGYAPRCVACGEAHLLAECSTAREQLKCCGLGGNHTANYRGCGKWKEPKAGTCGACKEKRCTLRRCSDGAHSTPTVSWTAEPRRWLEPRAPRGSCCQGPTRSPSQTHSRGHWSP